MSLANNAFRQIVSLPVGPMKSPRQLNTAALSYFLLISLPARLTADVVYLTNGNVLVVEKAWEEGAEIRYQTGGKVQVLPKSAVRRIQEQKSLPTPEGPSRRYGIAIDERSPSAPSEPKAPLDTPLRGGTSTISKELLNRLRENLKADPADALAKSELVRGLNSLASLQAAQGDLASAKSSLEEALALDKRNLAVLSNLAIINHRTGNYRASEDLLLTCLELDKRNQWTHYLLGEAYYAQEKVAQAIRQWTEALQLGPSPEISARLEKARQESGVHSELGVLQSAHFILRYDRKVSDYRLGQQILTTLESLYRQLSIDLTSQAPATVAVILYPDQAYFDITQAPSWSGALFDGKIRVPTKGLASVTTELSAVLVHELTHAFIRSLPGRGCPSWFNEGVAQFQEGKSASNYRKWLEALNKEGQLIPLKGLKGSFVGLSAGAASVAYIEGLAAVEHLVASLGKPSIRSILDLMGQNYNFENAFQKVTHQSVDEFDAAWRLSMSR
ncbi:MAG: tetratricopeptide repeat protein [Acidobacteria bacterium]|nr:tetratricopeptide repeat protein [Acidobacteriota bacterium]